MNHDKEKIANAIDEIVNSMVRIAGERDHIKEIKKMLKDEYGMEAKLVTALAKARYERALEKVREEMEEIVSNYEILFGEEE